MKWTIIIMMICSFLLSAQSEKLEMSFNDIMYIILEEFEIEDEDNNLYELYEEIYNNPININQANTENFLSLPFLSLADIENIINYKNQIGLFLSIEEIKLIPNLDNKTKKILKHFVVLKKKETSERESPDNYFNLESRHRVITDVQDRKGIKEGIYSGNKYKVYNRIGVSVLENYSLGITTEKDAGEYSYADFYSGFIKLKNTLMINEIILGDYNIEFGKGLAVWGAYRQLKSSNIISTARRKARGINEFRSSNELRFLRGIAASYDSDYLDFKFFVSKKQIDASIDDGIISSINESGLHRTENEIIKKNNLQYKSIGGILGVNFCENFKTSLLYIHNNLNYPLRFGNQGNELKSAFNNLAFSYHYTNHNFNISGEFSYNQKSVASINTIELNITKNILFISSLRNFPRNYFSFSSNAMSEGTGTQNEVGFYLGIRYKSSLGEFNFYYDQFKFPHSIYFNPFPSKGYELLLNHQVKITKSMDLQTQLKYKLKERKFNLEFSQPIGNRQYYKIKQTLLYNIEKNLRVKSRLEFIYSENMDEYESGFLTYQDIYYKYNNSLGIDFRIIYFSTKSFNSRLYVFEKDLPGIMLNQAVFGEGVKIYLLLQYKLIENLKISVKISQLYKPNLTYISSGNQSILSNKIQSISFQTDFQID